jgi:hypothetical protein
MLKNKILKVNNCSITHKNVMVTNLKIHFVHLAIGDWWKRLPP